MFLNFSNCKNLSLPDLHFFSFNSVCPFLSGQLSSFLSTDSVWYLLAVQPQTAPQTWCYDVLLTNTVNFGKSIWRVFQKWDETFFQGKFLLCVAFGRAREEMRAFTTGVQKYEKEACEKLVRKSNWCSVKAWIPNWRYSLHNSKMVYIILKQNLKCLQLL